MQEHLTSYSRPITTEPYMVQTDVGRLINDFERHLVQNKLMQSNLMALPNLTEMMVTVFGCCLLIHSCIVDLFLGICAPRKKTFLKCTRYLSILRNVHDALDLQLALDHAKGCLPGHVQGKALIS